MFAVRAAAVLLMLTVVVGTTGAQDPAAGQAAGGHMAIPVFVAREGQPVPGLAASDFIVRDSGVEQKPELVSSAAVPLNLLLALDCSSSLRGAPLDSMKEAARGAFAALRPEDQGALLTFSQNVNLRSGWTNDRDALAKAVDSMAVQGSTSLTDAAFAAIALRSRPASRTVIVFVTDGDDTGSWLSAWDVVQAARRAEVVISSVMMTTPGHTGAILGKAFAARDRAGIDGRARISQWLIDEPGLYRAALLPILALETGGETQQIGDVSSLPGSVAGLLAREGKRYLLQYTPTGVPATGWHPIQVEVRGGGEVSARTGYLR